MLDDPNLKKFLTGVDKSKFTKAPYVKKVAKPWGYELIFTPEGLPYPETGTIYRLEDDYSKGNETEEIRSDPNRGWNG